MRNHRHPLLSIIVIVFVFVYFCIGKVDFDPFLDPFLQSAPCSETTGIGTEGRSSISFLLYSPLELSLFAISVDVVVIVFVYFCIGASTSIRSSIRSCNRRLAVKPPALAPRAASLFPFYYYLLWNYLYLPSALSSCPIVLYRTTPYRKQNSNPIG